MHLKTGLRICQAALLIVGHAQGQSSAQELANRISRLWVEGSEAEFSAVFPFREGRQIHSNTQRAQTERVKGLSSVIRNGERRAVLLLSGVPLTGNSGDDTIYGMGFSGVHEAVADGGLWRLERSIRLEDLGEIRSKSLTVSVRPGKGLDVEDRLRVLVRAGNGFVARLNQGTKLRSVQAGGMDVPYQPSGGLLWADIRPGQAELTLKYTLEV